MNRRAAKLTIEQVAMRWQDLMDFWIAPGKQGPHAADWENKPHRIVYALIMLVAEGRVREDRLRATIRELRRQAVEKNLAGD